MLWPQVCCWLCAWRQPQEAPAAAEAKLQVRPVVGEGEAEVLRLPVALALLPLPLSRADPVSLAGRLAAAEVQMAAAEELRTHQSVVAAQLEVQGCWSLAA